MNTSSNLDWIIFECILKWLKINDLKDYREQKCKSVILKDYKMQKCKPVICIDDNIEFDTSGSCANFYGIDKSTISKVCRNETYFVRRINKSFKFKE